MTGRPVQSAGLVYLVNEAWKSRDDVGVSSIITQIDLFALDCLPKALGFAVVVGSYLGLKDARFIEALSENGINSTLKPCLRVSGESLLAALTASE